MTTAHGVVNVPPEQPFVGEGRQALVDDLFEVFDNVSGGSSPHWVSIEAPTGWGKTRLVRELYARLATERQDDGQFWPATILGALTSQQLRGKVENARKRIYPESIAPEPDSTPAWLWWGINCDRRVGLPMERLAGDIRQLERLQDGTQRRWRKAVRPSLSRRDRLRRSLAGDAARDRGREVVETGIGEGIAAGAGLLNVAVPGLGFVVLAAKWGVEAYSTRRSPDAEPSPDDPADDLVRVTAQDVSLLGRDTLPVVIVVEDLHLADESLVDVLSAVLRSTTRVLVVTTAWPGTLEDRDRPSGRLADGVPPDRMTRWRASDDARMHTLSVLDRKAMAGALLPPADDAVLTATAERFGSPFNLEMACRHWRLRTAIETHAEDPIEVVSSMPDDLKGLFELVWDELPSELRWFCMLAALSTPTTINAAEGAGDDRWDNEVLMSAALAVEPLRREVARLDGELANIGDAYEWVRRVTDWLQRFHEPLQREVAIDSAAATFGDPKASLGSYFQALVGHLAQRTGDQERDIHHARMLLALEAEGFDVPRESAIAGELLLCDWLAVQPDTASQLERGRLASKLMKRFRSRARSIGAGETPAPLISMGVMTQPDWSDPDWSDWVDGESPFGLSEEELDEGLGPLESVLILPNDTFLQDLVDAGIGGEDLVELQHMTVVRTVVNHFAASAERVGNLAAARLGYKFQLYLDREREATPEEIRRSAAHLARCIGESGDVVLAHALNERVLNAQLNDPDVPEIETLPTRHNLLRWHAKQLQSVGGDITSVVVEYERLIEDMQRLMDPDDRRLLTTRAAHASFLRQANPRRAAELASVLIEDQTAAFGPDDSTTLMTRVNHAVALWHAGDNSRATSMLWGIVSDASDSLDPGNPVALEASAILASLLEKDGDWQASIGAEEERLAAAARVHGATSEASLVSQRRLRKRYLDAWHGRSGDTPESDQWIEMAVVYARQLNEVEETPNSSLWLGETLHQQGKNQRTRGGIVEAAAALEESYRIYTDLDACGAVPEDYVERPAIVAHELGMVEVFLALGVDPPDGDHLRRAEARLADGLDRFRALDEAAPDRQYCRNLANSHQELGIVHRRLGDLDSARVRLVEAVSLNMELFELNPDAANERHLAVAEAWLKSLEG